MARLLDRVYVHVYVKSGDQTYDYGKARFEMLAAAAKTVGRPLDVFPIYSAEGETWRAGDEMFMGEWLRDYGMREAEKRFMEKYEAQGPKSLPVSGHQYFSHFFLEQYLWIPFAVVLPIPGVRKQG
jgi:hypothetical protein